MTQQIIRVLVVDDSAFLRKVVSQMLTRSPFIEVVGTARDGEEALEAVAQHRPDVVTLDLVMPRMDGVAFLQEQMRRRPVPVVVCSIAHESGELALGALEAGAVDFVQKPTALATERVFEMADELIEKVKAAATVRFPLAEARRAETGADAASSPSAAARHAQIVVLGVSTGGPQALRHLVPQLPGDFPVPLAMVLHMPVGYTEMYAKRLNDLCALEVSEAREGDVLRPGVALLAPAGRHLSFVRDGDGTVRAHLDLRPLDTQHRPAVDVLFQSAAEVYGGCVLGVVMTGMGQDGLLGAAHVKAQGGHVVTEAESSCVVYGMPRAVDEASLSDRSVPLEQMAAAIREMV
ncbi:MAG TPA: chemotaxis response regulator protein-glutamate methylesterase [Longimicrobium sp.]|nr:chemotaxis response regulator protein-glutamate methylesterase [Longimicrobium sp.]